MCTSCTRAHTLCCFDSRATPCPWQAANTLTLTPLQQQQQRPSIMVVLQGYEHELIESDWGGNEREEFNVAALH